METDYVNIPENEQKKMQYEFELCYINAPELAILASEMYFINDKHPLKVLYQKLSDAEQREMILNIAMLGSSNYNVKQELLYNLNHERDHKNPYRKGYTIRKDFTKKDFEAVSKKYNISEYKAMQLLGAKFSQIIKYDYKNQKIQSSWAGSPYSYIDNLKYYAELGDTDAMNDYAVALLVEIVRDDKSKLVKNNISDAYSLLLKAMDLGNSFAVYNLGFLIMEDIIKKKNAGKYQDYHNFWADVKVLKPSTEEHLDFIKYSNSYATEDKNFFTSNIYQNTTSFDEISNPSNTNNSTYNSLKINTETKTTPATTPETKTSSKPQNGKASYTYSDGVYDGDWKDGLREGFGKWTGQDGGTYEGNWKNDKKNGYGTQIFGEGKWKGEKYEGNFVDNIRQGNGKYTFANGNIYDGDWKDGVRNGKGRIIINDKNSKNFGSVYDGDWKDSNWHGKGKMTYANGKVEEGNWENGKFIGK